MRNFKRLILVVFFLLLVAAVLIFVLENQQPATLAFLGLTLPSMPLSVFVLVALVLGLSVGPLVVLGSRVLRR
ncbi:MULTISPECIES: lipopolysaccharide assembly protein LapA domain-containing protein [unclassified Pseudomonas]|uniref:lipopolysaccharide assembly protein LapA domain-containing protein n=1 Tax=Pseudomonas sp. JV241A TaxID=2078785 RepID=UPI000F9C018B|nr:MULTISPECIES: lipopolysaccharide assembly protein LapA domain-containing protein [unclassified Pseudomonas]MCE5981333.1 lipopolysaccharide assembly protein LapA domain-containing protein [Pseudomonas sp. LF19]